MSKLSDYSKFDHLVDESSSDEEVKQPKTTTAAGAVLQPTSNTTPAPIPTSESSASSFGIRRHPSIAKRFVFECSGKPIYEFEQSLSEVILYVPTPPQNSGTIVCNISANKLQLGLKGAAQNFLDESTFAAVDTTDSTWCFEEDEGIRKIVIYLQKAAKGVVWKAALKGRFNATLDPLSLEQVQKELMLERWQEEHPGMDFRGANFSGSAPDPRTFMGGVQYD